MQILVTGQCSLHIGRMEFGNIGNYYIIEPFFQELHRVFPDAQINTTLQMSDDFCHRENIHRLPMELYYSWSGNDLANARAELDLAHEIARTGLAGRTTPYIDAVLLANPIVDFSGDIWGANADLLGPDRFEVGLCKNRVAQILNRKTALIAGSPGPFSGTLDFAREVFAGFDLVTNREAVSKGVLEENGFDCENVHDLACPAFLFEPSKDFDVRKLLYAEKGLDPERPVIGYILCGWNFTQGPFDRWPRTDDEYLVFLEAARALIESEDAQICLMSHANGFDLPAPPFHLKKGRDFPIAQQFASILAANGYADNIVLLDGLYSTWDTKSIIGAFDMLVSGRIHAAVAGLSQLVPCCIIDYGHEPKAHKLRGFAEVAGVPDLVCDPADGDALRQSVLECWRSRAEIRKRLSISIPRAQVMARQNFELLRMLPDGPK